MAHFDYFKTTTHAGEPTLDFTLPFPDSEEVTLSKLRGKPVMIEFGSITWPPCQAEFPLMDQMAQDFAHQAHFLFVYVRGAHPDDDSTFPIHKTTEQKMKHARIMQEQHSLQNLGGFVGRRCSQGV